MISPETNINEYIKFRLDRAKGQTGIGKEAEIVECIDNIILRKDVYGKLSLQDRFTLKLSHKQLNDKLDRFHKQKPYKHINIDLRSLANLLSSLL